MYKSFLNTYCALGTVLVTKEAAEDIAWRLHFNQGDSKKNE